MAHVVRAAAVQAEPRWLDLDAGVEHMTGIIADAAARGVQLVAFPEPFIPRYPGWIWLDAPAMGLQLVPMRRIAAAAAEHGVHVVFGFSERAGGSLYMSQAIISDTGEIVGVRRKLKPTHVERSVFGEGDGSDLQVHDTPLGRVGALNCWEHIQPLTKYAMFSFGEQIHVGSWPSFSVYRGAAQALGPEVNNAASLIYAVEGGTFVVAPCATVGPAAHDLFCDTELKRNLLLQGGGFARIYGPEGSPLGENLDETQEGLVVADLDFSLIAIAKSAADPVGHYSRPDVLRVVINRAANPAVMDRAPSVPAFAEVEPVAAEVGER